MKLSIGIGITVFGTIGGIIGQLIEHQSIWGINGWGLLLGTIGSFFGIWVGYKMGKRFF
jgi:hypothetical protein